MWFARVRRWWYLITEGMFVEECAVTLYDDLGNLCVIGSGRPVLGRPGEFVNYKIWWSR